MSQYLASQTNALPLAPLLQALAVNRATYYRSRIALPAQTDTSLSAPQEEERGTAGVGEESVPAPRRCRVPGRALTGEERAEVYRHLYDDRFIDRTVQEIWATLLDEGIYLCSRPTFYRLLKADRTHTKRPRAPRHYTRPELLAPRVHQLWSWDIPKLKGPARWTYFNLYVMHNCYY